MLNMKLSGFGSLPSFSLNPSPLMSRLVILAQKFIKYMKLSDLSSFLSGILLAEKTVVPYIKRQTTKGKLFLQNPKV